MKLKIKRKIETVTRKQQAHTKSKVSTGRSERTEEEAAEPAEKKKKEKATCWTGDEMIGQWIVHRQFNAMDINNNNNNNSNHREKKKNERRRGLFMIFEKAPKTE